MAAFVCGVVVAGAEWDHVVEVGCSAGFPVVDVVDLAVMERCRAIGDGTCGVDGLECTPLTDRSETSCSTDVERDAVAIEHDRDDFGLTREAPDGGRR